MPLRKVTSKLSKSMQKVGDALFKFQKDSYTPRKISRLAASNNHYFNLILVCYFPFYNFLANKRFKRLIVL